MPFGIQPSAPSNVTDAIDEGDDKFDDLIDSCSLIGHCSGRADVSILDRRASTNYFWLLCLLQIRRPNGFSSFLGNCEIRCLLFRSLQRVTTTHSRLVTRSMDYRCSESQVDMPGSRQCLFRLEGSDHDWKQKSKEEACKC